MLGWYRKSIMRMLCAVLLLATLLGDQAQAQTKTTPFNTAGITDLLPSPGILRNSVSNIHAQGDSL